MKWFLAVILSLLCSTAYAELLDYSDGQFTEATAKVDTATLNDRLNQTRAKVGQVTERCASEISGVYAELEAVQKDMDIANAVDAGATLAEAKDAISVKPIEITPIEVDMGIYK